MLLQSKHQWSTREILVIPMHGGSVYDCTSNGHVNLGFNKYDKIKNFDWYVSFFAIM